MISFSGIDCSGKTTQIELLTHYLKTNNLRSEVVWSRGGYTPGIEMVKRIIRRGKNRSKEERIAHSGTVNKKSKMRKILFTASLIDLWLYYSVVLRLKGINKIVICDRYIWDTYIDFKMKYPDYNFENGFWWRMILKTMVNPKFSFCLFIPAEESMRRSAQKEEPFPESVELRRTRIDWYLKELNNNRWEYKIDATKPIDEVFKSIIRIINIKDEGQVK